MDNIVIYTDGGCRDNQLADKSKVVGAWGVILMYKDKKKYLSSGTHGTTNNEMELMAICQALKAIKTTNIPIIIHSDSQYAINCITLWMDNWKRNGWKNAKNKPVANSLLIKEIDNQMSRQHSVIFKKVKGHADDPLNIEVDALVNKTMDKLEVGNM